MTEHPELTALMIAILIAIIGLIGTVLSLKKNSIKSQKESTPAMCAYHPNLESRINNLEIRLASFEGKLDGLSAHIGRIEGKIDVLSVLRINGDK